MPKNAAPGKPLGNDDWGPLPPEGTRLRHTGPASLFLASVSTALLVASAASLRIDRTTRFADVTYHGPAAAWVGRMTLAGLLTSFAAVFLTAHEISRKEGGTAFSTTGMVLALVNLLGSCLVFACAAES